MFTVKAIVPDSPLIDVSALEQAVNDALDTAARWVESDFEQTMVTWDNKSEFQITTPEPGVRNVFTNDAKYAWINYGTRESREGRTLYPKRPGGKLRFTKPFAAKTQKNVIGSYQGSRGDEVVIRASTNMSFIEPREFDETIAREFNDEDRLGKLIQEEINKVS